MEIQTPIPDFEAIAKEAIDKSRRYAMVYCLNFFKDSFKKQGFTDTSFNAWENRVSPDYRAGGALLVSTSFLLESLKVLSGNKTYIEFGTYAPYAEIHNEGGVIKIKITKKSRKYFWYMYKKTNDTKWKAMALTKKDIMTVKIPKRQFIGESAKMMEGLDEWFFSFIVQKFKNL
ncbi:MULTISPECIES: hypothetical protein [Chryseobacterium]|uniref:Uncharacterized protein n=1 Tax=Candidatus Chryseobacterium massiliense TaxID=204089 RepID=A0A3D9B2K9_9FLAO|nr:MULTISPECIES: hypothetical protein [Chryseobacterium]REC47861.1 hypothetical protein DRF68_12530 [Candidatus Chryseobacterium massiliae]